MSQAAAVHAKVLELARHVLTMTTTAGSGHPSSALSMLHLVVSLMYRHMRWDPADPWNADADRLVLSEGHAVPAVYAAYADLGGMVGGGGFERRRLTMADLSTLREAGSVLDGHPNPAEGFPFFDAATGSLGQGLSVAAGLGVAARLSGSPRHIYAILGDGESREGQVWEAVDFIADHGLSSVTAIFNCNGQGQADFVSPQQSAARIAAKLRAYGWEAIELDGHDPDAIDAALAQAAAAHGPVGLVARTQKGWGVSGLKAKTNHGKPLPAGELAAAFDSLKSTGAALPVATAPLDRTPPAPVKASRDRVAAARPSLPAFADGLARVGLAAAIAARKLSTRRAYGAALALLGESDERIVALDADVSNSTFSEMFAARHPERFFECKIAEQNMVSTAVGLAAAGRVPFVNSFGKFLARAYDQVELAAITRANVKLVGSHSGVSLAADGPSQMSLPDVAFFRSLGTVACGERPACLLFQPADAPAAYALTLLMARHAGMCYMRTHRPDVPFVYDGEAAFEPGGCNVLRRGDAVALVSAGYMVHECLAVAAALEAERVHCTVIDAYALPLRAADLWTAGESSGHRFLCVEDNYGAGLGSAVAEVVAQAGRGRAEVMTCRRIPKSGRTAEDVLRLVGLWRDDIAARVREMLT